jgi:diaminohydroxyphosphoribosylaminopyrimidine deaminase/5-amino-6-(5-phosphoribosylamino)uracil reductase
MPTSAPELDEQFMRRAIRLAMNGRGRVEPNPMVGCVIVKDGQVIGEGFHAQFGGPHAEPTSLANCTRSPEGATAYVTLEPCCHTNKKTPPCTPRLIEAKVSRVVIGCFDPNPDVNGKGVAMLRQAGIRVDGPVLEGPAKQLVAPFLAAQQAHQRPYVTLKWAQTADRKVAGARGQRLRITGDAANQVVHGLRSRCDGLLVGINTILTDDPLLTVRGMSRPRSLRRIILDARLRLPLSAKVLMTLDEGGVTVCKDKPLGRDLDKCTALRNAGVEMWDVPSERDSPGMLSLDYVLGACWDAGLHHVLVEPGPTLAKSFLDHGAGDRIWVLRSRSTVNEPSAPSAASVPDHFLKTGEIDLAGDVLAEYLNPASPVFFADEPSADFVLAKEPCGQ